MQNNKIYTTLANLYNQFKMFVGDTGRSLSEEVDHRIKNSSEVADARDGHATLSGKIASIDRSIDDTNSVISDTRIRVDKTEGFITGINEQIDVIRTTTPTVKLDNGNHMLVNLTNRPAHKTNMFFLDAGDKYKTRLNSEHYINQLYVMDSIIKTEADFSITEQNSDFDKIKNDLKNGSLYARQTGEMKMPLSGILIAHKLYDDVAFVPGLCHIQGVTTAPYLNTSSHVVSAFRAGYEWSIQSRMSEIILELVYPVEITKILFNFSANTDRQSVSLSKLDDKRWVEIKRVDSADGQIVINETLKSIKIGFYSLSDSDTTLLKIKDIEIFSKEYAESSGVVTVGDTINSYDLSGDAKINTIIDIPEHVNCRFGINSSENSEDCYVYYPSRRYLSAGLFSNIYGMSVFDKITSELEDSYVLDYRLDHKDVTKNDGTLKINSVTWVDTDTVSLSNGYELDALTYVKIYIKTKTEYREVALNQEMLNEITILSVDGIEVLLEVKNVKNSIKLGVKSKENIASVKCDINTVQNLYSSGYRDTSIYDYTDYHSSSVSRTYDSEKQMYSLSSSYNCGVSVYKWTYAFRYWAWRYYTTYTSGFNKSSRESIIFVDCDSMRSNLCYTTETSTGYYKTTSFILDNVSNAVAYISVNDNAVVCLNSDATIIPSHDYSRVSSDNEFIGCMRIDKEQKINKIEPDQYSDLTSDVEYFISFNNYSFYTYSQETNSWNQTKEGMSFDEVIRIQPHAFEKLHYDDAIYIKVRINNKNAYVNGVYLEFDKDKFTTIHTSQIKDRGMTIHDTRDVRSSFIMDFVNETGMLNIYMVSDPKLRCWQYVVPGVNLIEYGGEQWMTADSGIATQHLSGDMLIISNVSDKSRRFKLEQKFFEDSVVSIGDELQNESLNEVIEKVDVLSDSSNTAHAKLALAEQSIKILHKAVEYMSADSWYGLSDEVPNSSESLSFEIPTFIMSDRLEIDLDPLLPGCSTEICDVRDFSYLQYWTTERKYAVESIESETTKELQRQFAFSNGTFTSDYFEIAKEYDTDNSYLMSRAFSDEKSASYKTSDYICTSKFYDGTDCGVTGAGLYTIMYNSRDGQSSLNNDYAYGFMAYFDLPGEDKRFVDIDIDFNESKYISGLFNMDFNCTSRFGYPATTTGYATMLNANQYTVIMYDVYGNGNWIEHHRFTGIGTNVNCVINKEVKKIRIRLEIPYQNNRGSGMVSLKYFDIYYCPVRYNHSEDTTIKPVLYYNTQTFKSITSVYSDATVFGSSADIRYLFEVNDRTYENKKYLSLTDGGLSVTQGASYSDGVALHAFNTLTEEQLKPLLEYDYVRPIAILKSSDGLHSPSIRSFVINYLEKPYTVTTIVPEKDIITRYDRKAKKIVVTNATDSIKTLRAVIS